MNTNTSLEQLRRIDEEVIAGLRKQVAEFTKRRDDLTNVVRSLEFRIATMEAGWSGKGAKSFYTKTGRLSNAAGRSMREQYGRVLYDYLADRRGQLFARADLQHNVAEHHRHMWGKIIAEWNADHPKAKILDNGKPTGSRKYFVR